MHLSDDEHLEIFQRTLNSIVKLDESRLVYVKDAALSEFSMILMEVCKESGISIEESMNDRAKKSVNVRNMMKTWFHRSNDSFSRHSSIGSFSRATRRESFCITKQRTKAVADTYQDILSFLDLYEEPLITAELSCLVDIIQHPQDLFAEKSGLFAKCKDGGFIFKLIQHVKDNLDTKDKVNESEKIAISVLHLLKNVVAITNGGNENDKGKNITDFQDPEAEKLRDTLLKRCFSTTRRLEKPPLEKIQEQLKDLGAVDLIISLVSLSGRISQTIFNDCIELGISLLNGGNDAVQTAFLEQFHCNKTRAEQFFRAIYNRLDRAHDELRNAQPLTLDLTLMTGANASGGAGGRRESGKSDDEMGGSRRPTAFALPAGLRRELDTAARQTMSSLQECF